jgi:hypothetical protein
MVEAIDVQLVRVRHIAPIGILNQKSRKYDERGRILQEKFGGYCPCR